MLPDVIVEGGWKGFATHIDDLRNDKLFRSVILNYPLLFKTGTQNELIVWQIYKAGSKILIPPNKVNETESW